MTDFEKNLARPVTVTVMGGDNIPFDFEPGLTVGNYLERARLNLGRGEVVTLNGAPATLEDPVEENSVLVVVRKVANG